MATSNRKRNPKAPSSPEIAADGTAAEQESKPERPTKTRRAAKARQPVAATEAQPAVEPQPTVEAPQIAGEVQPDCQAQAERTLVQLEDCPLQAEHSNGNSATHEDIKRRAYELFVARGGAHGNDLEDWFRAEREFRTLE